ncbi:NAD(P)-binding protein [Amycolatopsis sp. NPDC058986]|uniref:NAD(P)-binding protein n=1 Tax=unclassified Amycolatopsis TaxID=2618356 RepID=UPI00367340C1
MIEYHETVVVGGGFGGICAAHGLLEEGRGDFVILERAGELGGVWRDNRYPNAACDVPAHFYSLSFAPNPTWTRSYAPWDEILAYINKVADDLGVGNASGYKWGLVFNRANEHTGFIPVNYLKYADPDVDCGAAGSDLQVKWNQTLYQCPGSNCNQGQAIDGQHVRFFCNFYDSAARTWWRWVFNPNNQHEGFAYVQNQPGAANC